MRNRVRTELRQAIDELYALISGLKTSSGGGLVKTYSAQNAGPVTAPAGGPTVLCSIAGVVVAAGQKVIVHESVNYTNGEGNSGALQSLTVDAATVDEVGDSLTSLQARTVTRVFEFTPAAGTHTFTLQAQPAGSPSLTIFGPGGGPGGVGTLAGAQLVVEVVKV